MASLFRFPTSLNGNGIPSITFSAKDSSSGAPAGGISLFMPQSFSIGDGAQFGNFDLGVIGASIGKEMKDGQQFQAKDISSSLSNAPEQHRNAIVAQAFTNFGITGSTAGRANDIYKQQKGIAINPNTVLQYTGAELRSYSFQFTLVPELSSDSAIIRGIHKFLQTNMYAKGTTFVLEYPSIFNISFNNVANIPNPKQCYLTNMNTTYNPGGNIFMSDGSPNEVQLQLTFRETQALKREDLF